MKTKNLLIIAHAPSDNTKKMVTSVLRGASHADTMSTVVRILSPTDATAADILSADALIIGTVENLGYMSGLTKDLFDRCYYPCLDKTEGLPVALYIRAGHDGTGTIRSLQSIFTGLRWKLVQEPLVCKGDFDNKFLKECEELGQTIAISLDVGII